VAAAVLQALSKDPKQYGLASLPSIEGRSPHLPPSKEAVTCLNVLSRTLMRAGDGSAAIPLLAKTQVELLRRYCDAPVYLHRILSSLSVVGPQKKVFPGGYTAWTTGGINMNGRTIVRLHFDDGKLCTEQIAVETGIGSERVMCRVQADVPSEDLDEDELTETMSACAAEGSGTASAAGGGGGGGGGGEAGSMGRMGVEAAGAGIAAGRARAYSEGALA